MDLPSSRATSGILFRQAFQSRIRSKNWADLVRRDRLGRRFAPPSLAPRRGWFARSESLGTERLLDRRGKAEIRLEQSAQEAGCQRAQRIDRDLGIGCGSGDLVVRGKQAFPLAAAQQRADQ